MCVCFYANNIHLIRILTALLVILERRFVRALVLVSSWAMHTNLFCNIFVEVLLHSLHSLHRNSNTVCLHSVVQSIESWQTICKSGIIRFVLIAFLFLYISYTVSLSNSFATRSEFVAVTPAGNANLKRKRIDKKPHVTKSKKTLYNRTLRIHLYSSESILTSEIRFYTNSSPFDVANECSLSKQYSLLKWSKLNSPFRQHRVTQQQKRIHSIDFCHRFC